MFMTIYSQFGSKIVLIVMAFYFRYIVLTYLHNVQQLITIIVVIKSFNDCFLARTLQVISSP